MTQERSEEWQLSARGAEVYDDILVPSIFAPWVPKIIGMAGLRPDQDILDVACGTGIVAEAAFQHVGPEGSVVGLDINSEMLEVAAARRNRSITWVNDDAEHMPFPDQDFDRVLCQLGLQYFANPSAAISEMHRVLKDDGRAVLMVWRGIEHSPGFALLADLIGEHLGVEIGESMRGPFAFGDNEAGLGMLLQAAQFTEVEIAVESDTVHFQSVEEFVGQQLAASPLGNRDDFSNQPWASSLISGIMDGLGIHDSSQPVSFAVEAYLAAGRRSGPLA